MLDQTDVHRQFRDAMAKAGLAVAGDLVIGDMARADVTAKGAHGEGDGSYLLHINVNFAAGGFQNFIARSGWKKWHWKRPGWKPSAKEQRELKRTQELQKRQREEFMVALRAEARERALRIWDEAAEAANEHPYCQRKQVEPYGLRTKTYPDGDNPLLVPMFDADENLVNIQYIHAEPDRHKHGLKGGPQAGCHHWVNWREENWAGLILICEGWATAVTVYQATESQNPAVIAAFNCDNLRTVAEWVRERHPHAQIIVCADDDWKLDDNPGLTHAHTAARAVGGLVAVPKFGADRDDKSTDFNDLYVTTGLDAVTACIDAASEPEPEPDDGEGDEGDEGDDGGGSKEKQSDVLIELAAEAELFHNNDDGNGYADIVIDGHRETWAIGSKSFKRWLTKRYYEQTEGGAPNNNTLSTALLAIEAKAQFDGVHRDVAVRLAGHDNKIYLDLCDAPWRVVEVDTEGWRVVDNPPVRFVRRKGMQALPVPVEGGKLWTLKKFINIKTRDDFILVMSWLVAAMNPRGGYPVGDVTGETGTAKTTMLKMLRNLIDPNITDPRALPREEREVFIAASNSFVQAYDNLSWLPDWMSNACCRLSTGGGFAARELYTDDGERLFTGKHPILLGSIEQTVKRGDLADRIISLLLEPIPDEKRRDEEELWEAYERDRPALLGGLLKAVSRGLKRLPSIKAEKGPRSRMADFINWAIACGDGYLWQPGEFKAAYAANRAGVTADVVEAEVVSTAIQMLMRPPCPACRGRGTVGGRTCGRCKGTGTITARYWTGTATELLTKLELLVGQRVASAKSWPGSPSALSNRFNRLATPLRRIGIEVDRGDRKHGGVRTISIKDVEVRESPSPPSPPSPQSMVATGNLFKDKGLQKGDGGDGGDGDMQTLPSASSPAPSPAPPQVNPGLARRALSYPHRPGGGFNYRQDEQSLRAREQRVVDAQRALAKRRNTHQPK